jgi:hypothetical protein
MRNGKITRQMTATGTVEYILKWPDFAVPGNFFSKTASIAHSDPYLGTSPIC